MYIVRVDFRNGLHAECNYGGTDGLGRAERCRETVVAAMNIGTALPPKQAVCEVYDDAGRRYNWDGAQIQSVGLIDLESETIAAIRIKQFVEGLARKHDPSAFPQQRAHPVAQEAGYVAAPSNGAAPQPAIGGEHFSA